MGGDALQQLPRLVEAGQRFRVVEPGAARDDRDLLGSGFALESVQGADDLFGVLVPLDRVQFDLFLVRERAPKKDWAVFCRSADSLVH